MIPNCQGADVLITKPVMPCLKSRADETAYIHGETSRLDDIIQQLHGERAMLLRRLNAVQATTSVFPPETLSLIFQFTCLPSLSANSEVSPFEGADGPIGPNECTARLFHLRLAAVSWLWRQVVHTTPQLWSFISLKATDVTSLLRLHFDNSGSLPLDLTLSGCSGLNMDSYLHTTISEHFVQRNLLRIQSLKVSAPPGAWLFFSHYLTGLVELTLDLVHKPSSLTTASANVIDLVLTNHPHLRKVNLYSGHYAKIELPWATITALNLHGIAADICAGTVVQCHNLAELIFDAKPSQQPYDGSSLSHPVTLRNLHTLKWVYHADSWSRGVLGCLQLPALETLTWVEMYLGPYDEGTVSFLSHLPSTLSSLILLNFSIWCSAESILLDLLPPHVNLESLRLVDSDPDFILRVIHKITPTSCNSFSSLRKLTIKESKNVTGLSGGFECPEFSNGMLEMLEARNRVHPQCPFRVEFIWIDFGWETEDQMHIQGLLDAGARIQVVVKPDYEKD
ncbi:hypothetical protein P691DRAFT_791132 [Macrolepiota fuliginosa MF-IS2]|uniref:F-box domain-containing protein n=1 Tax=Macrolepiota fuliginosa MF-IS2 TaxID=1400762 RepID=A0A9P6C2B7_9AGAR|nr:hypothetical protein P691DRAFT_791132 [Macrolepiota fuliginosa MF-IS2]